MNSKRMISLFLTLISFVPAFSQSLFINEFMSSNSTTILNPDYQNSADWIEIYNASEKTISLTGYFLTDNLNDSTKWRIPDNTEITAGHFLLFWADGQNNENHTNYKLSSRGEEIALFDPHGVLIDSVRFSSQDTDISCGRQPDGGAEWFHFDKPTPGAPNESDVYLKAETPQFSLPSGYYTKSQVLELYYPDNSAVIRYTLDCSDPDETSSIYTAPIEIKSRAGEPNLISMIKTNQNPFGWLPDWTPPAGEVFKVTVIRARAFIDGYLPSDIVTKTYFIDENISQRYPTIAVISLVSEYKNLFNDSTGIYVPGIHHIDGEKETGNYFMGWEKPAHIEFFEPGGDIAFSQNVGIRIQGGTSPTSPQKGLHVFARNEYGYNRIDYPIFKNSQSAAKELTEYKRFIIRAWGSCILKAKINDALSQRMYEHGELDIQAYRPAILFLNGEYWGLHECREANKNSWYYQFHHGIDRENPGIDIIEQIHGVGPTVDEGDMRHWKNLNQYLKDHPMEDPEHYEYIKTQMDIQNFIAYLGHCMILVKWDWPRRNEASWRPRTPDGKWRWIQFDMESCVGLATTYDDPKLSFLGPDYNMFKHASKGHPIPYFDPFGPHPILVKLLENQEFKNDFKEWFEEKLDTDFSSKTMNAILDEMVTELEPYMPEHQKRWPYDSETMDDWYAQIDVIRDFINRRPDFVKQHLTDYFATGDVEKNTPTIKQYKLHQNFPNPFNPTTAIEYEVARAGTVQLVIYDLRGRHVCTLEDSRKPAGRFQNSWDGMEKHGMPASAGVYLCRLRAGEYTKVVKMVLVR